MKTKQFIITDRIFKTETLFILDCSAKEFVKRIRRRGGKIGELEECVNGMVFTFPAGGKAIWVKNKKDTGTIVHEIFHLVVRICEHKGIPLMANYKNGEVGDETASYLMEFYVNEVNKKLHGKHL